MNGPRKATSLPHVMPPRREEFLPFHRPTIGEEEVREVSAVLRSGWLTTGARVKQLEERLRERLGCAEAVAVNSCTAALHLALVTAGVGPGDEVVTTPYTFSSTGETILYTGARPVFVDVLPGTANLDPERLEAAITDRTRAILPVHMAGYPCEMDRIAEIAARRGLPVIEDAAHAMGTAYRGRPVGSLSRFTCFSFYATKNLTTGEGGLLALGDPDDAARVRRLSLHGLSRDAWKRYMDAGSWSYAIEDLGFKYNMPDFAAAIGLCQLERFEEEQRRREEIAAHYRTLLADCEAVELPPETQAEGDRHAWHLFIVRLHLDRLRVDRDTFARRLQEANLGISVHFIPLHLHPLYRQALGTKEGDYPVAEGLFRRAISLPFFPSMIPSEVEYVAAVVRALAEEFRR
ncbi:MAG: DegT/DnrJ/EryC1/StrS family aminotransferase [Acidobacteriota bacterium]|jgi:perosamine synthetase